MQLPWVRRLFFLAIVGFFGGLFLFNSSVYAAGDYGGLYGFTKPSVNDPLLNCANHTSDIRGSYTTYSGKSLTGDFITNFTYSNGIALLFQTGGIEFKIKSSGIIPSSLLFTGRSDGFFDNSQGNAIIIGDSYLSTISKFPGVNSRGPRDYVFVSIPQDNWNSSVGGNILFYQTFSPSHNIVSKNLIITNQTPIPSLRFCYAFFTAFCGDGIKDDGNQDSAFVGGNIAPFPSGLNGGEECDNGQDNGKPGNGCTTDCKIVAPPDIKITKQAGIYNPAGGGSCSPIGSSAEYHKKDIACYIVTISNSGGTYTVPGGMIMLDDEAGFPFSNFGSICKKISGPTSFTNCNVSSSPPYKITLQTIPSIASGESISFFMSGQIDDNILQNNGNGSRQLQNQVKWFSGNTNDLIASSNFVSNTITRPDISINVIGPNNLIGKKIGDTISFDITVQNIGTYDYKGKMVLSGDFKGVLSDITLTKQAGSHANCLPSSSIPLQSNFNIDIINTNSFLPKPSGVNNSIIAKCSYKVTGKLAKFFISTSFNFYAGYTGGPIANYDINNPEPSFSPYFPDNNKSSLSLFFEQSGSCILDKQVAIGASSNNFQLSKIVSSGDIIKFRISGYNNTNAPRGGSVIFTFNDTLSPYDMLLNMESNGLFDFNVTNKTFSLKVGQTILPGSGFVVYLTGLITGGYYDQMFNNNQVVTNTIGGNINLGSIGGDMINCNSASASISTQEEAIMQTEKYVSGSNYFMSGEDKIYYYTIGDIIDYYFKLVNVGNTGYKFQFNGLRDIIRVPSYNYFMQNTLLLDPINGFSVYNKSGSTAVCHTGVFSTGYFSPPQFGHYKMANNEQLMDISVGGYCTYKLSFSVSDFTGSGIGQDGCIKVRDYGYFGYLSSPSEEFLSDLSYVDVCIYKPTRKLTKTIGTGLDGSGYVTGSDHFNIGDNYIYQICADLQVASGVVVNELILEDTLPIGLYGDKDTVFTLSPNNNGTLTTLFMGSDKWEITLTGLTATSGSKVCINISGTISGSLQVDASGAFINNVCYGDKFLSGSTSGYNFTGCVTETGYLNKTDIGITKSLTGDIPTDGYTVGDPISFAITVYNSGDRAMTGYKIVDDDLYGANNSLFSLYGYDPSKNHITTYSLMPGCGTLQITNTPVTSIYNITVIGADLQPGSYCTYIISGYMGSIQGDGNCKNTVSLTGFSVGETTGFNEVETNNSFTLSGINCLPEGTGVLEIVKTTDKQNYVLGEYIIYTITVNNIGSGKTYDNILKDILPTGIGFNNPISLTVINPQGGIFNVGRNPSQNMYTYPFDISPGSGFVVTFTGQAIALGHYCNIAEVERRLPDPNGYNPIPGGPKLASIPFSLSGEACVDIVAPSCTIGVDGNTLPPVNVSLVSIDNNQITVNYNCPDVGMSFVSFEAIDPKSPTPYNPDTIKILASGDDLIGSLTYTLPAGTDINDLSQLPFQCNYGYPNNFTGANPLSCFGNITLSKPSCQVLSSCGFNDGQLNLLASCVTGATNTSTTLNGTLCVGVNCTPIQSLPILNWDNGAGVAGPDYSTTYNFQCDVIGDFGFTESCDGAATCPTADGCSISAPDSPIEVPIGGTTNITATCSVGSDNPTNIIGFTASAGGPFVLNPSLPTRPNVDGTLSNVGKGTYTFNCQLTNGLSCMITVEVIEKNVACPNDKPATCDSEGTKYGPPPDCNPETIPKLDPESPECKSITTCPNDKPATCDSEGIKYSPPPDCNPETIPKLDPESPECKSATTPKCGPAATAYTNQNDFPIGALCDPGTPTTPQVFDNISNTRNWQCTNPDSSSPVDCTATYSTGSMDGICGDNNGKNDYLQSIPTSNIPSTSPVSPNWCKPGEVVSFACTPSSPDIWTSCSWSCRGINGGNDSAQCKMEREWCGDGEINGPPGAEQCDNGSQNGQSGSNCNKDCKAEKPDCSEPNISPTPEYYLDDLPPGGFLVTCNGTNPSQVQLNALLPPMPTTDNKVTIPISHFQTPGQYTFNCIHTIGDDSKTCSKSIEIKTREWICPPANTDQILTWTSTPSAFYLEGGKKIVIGGTADINCKNIALNQSTNVTKNGTPLSPNITVDPSASVVGNKITFIKTGNYTVSCNFNIDGGNNPYKCDYNIEVVAPYCQIDKVDLTNNGEEYADIVPNPFTTAVQPPEISNLFDPICKNTVNGLIIQSTNIRKGNYELRCFLQPKGINPLPPGFPTDLYCAKGFNVQPVGAAGKCKNMILANGQLVVDNGSLELSPGLVTIACADSSFTATPSSVQLTGGQTIDIICKKADISCRGTIKGKSQSGNLSCNPNGKVDQGEQCDPQMNNNGNPTTNPNCTNPVGYCNDQCNCKTDTSTINCGQNLSITLQGEQVLGSTVNIACAGGQIVSGYPNYSINGGSPISSSSININTTGSYNAICKFSSGNNEYECPAGFTIDGNTPTNETGCQNLTIQPDKNQTKVPVKLDFSCVGAPTDAPFVMQLKKSDGTAITSFQDKVGSYEFTGPGDYILTCKVGNSDKICIENIKITNQEPTCKVTPTVIKEDEYGTVDYKVEFDPPGSFNQADYDITCGFTVKGLLIGYQQAWGGTFSSIRKGNYSIKCSIKLKTQESWTGAKECIGGPINILPVGAAGKCKDAVSVQVATKISDNPYMFTTQSSTVTVSCNGGMTLQGPSTLDMLAQNSYDVTCSKGDIVCSANIKSEPRCGDKIVQADKQEECDQGTDNGKQGINCSSTCKLIDKNMNCPPGLTLTPSLPAKNQSTTIKCDGIGGQMQATINGPVGSSNLPGNGPNLSASFVPTADGSYSVICKLSSGGLSMECGQASFNIGSGNNNQTGNNDNGSGDYDPNNDPNLYDLAISKTVTSEVTKIGSLVSFEIVVRNEGLLTATGFSIKDLVSGLKTLKIGRSPTSMRSYNGDITKDILLAYPLTLSGRSSQKFYMEGILDGSGFINKVQVCDYNSDLDPDSDSCNGYDKQEDDNDIVEGDIYSSIIGDFVRNDKNKDGIQTTGEQGIRNIPVALVGCEDNKTYDITTTDTIGKYNFFKIKPGDYKVGFVLPGGYIFTQSNIGANDNLDSDINLTPPGSITGYTDCFTVVGGVNQYKRDAGMYYQGANISVTKIPDRKFVTTGDYVKWFINLKNTSNTFISHYDFKDFIPPGMRYVSMFLSGDQEQLDVCGYPVGRSGSSTIGGNITNANLSGGLDCNFVLTTQVKADSNYKLHTNTACIDGNNFDESCGTGQVQQISLCKNISLDKDYGDNPLDVNFTCTLSGTNSGYIKIFDANEQIVKTFGLAGNYKFEIPGIYYIECVANFNERCIRPIEVREFSECTNFNLSERSPQDYDMNCSGAGVQDMKLRVYEGYIDPISQKIIGQVVYQTGGSIGRYQIGGGSYVFQCLVNNSVDYRFDYLSGAKSSTYSCYYKTLPNGAPCAVRTQVAPYRVSVPVLQDFKYTPEPIIYCPLKGEFACATFQESKLVVKDYICRKEVVIPQPDLVVTKTGNKLIYQSGEVIDYRIDFYNTGDGKIVGLKMVDDLPVGMKLLGWSGNFSFIPNGLTTTINQNISTNVFMQSGEQLSWNLQSVIGDHKPVVLSGYINIKTQVIDDLRYPLKNKIFGIVKDERYLPDNLGQYTVYPSGWNFSGISFVGDKVWSDTNFDGIQNSTERGIKNIRVELMNCSGKVLDYTYSDAKGYYSFDNVMTGYYKIGVTLSSGWIFTYGKIGRDDSIDSDITLGRTTNCRYIRGDTKESDIDIGLYDISTYPEGSCNYNGVWEENLGEQCDGEDGIKGNYEKCIKCTKFTYNSVCGDGILQPNEDCEKNKDGKYNDINITGTSCLDCKFYSGAVCGNGIMEDGEKCEVNSAPVKGLQCIGCQLVVNTLASCGNGILEVGEGCDLGSGNATFANIGGSGVDRDKRCSANCNIINCDYNFCFKPKPPNCTQSDSPNVMLGEYFPFWWNIDDRLVINTNTCSPGKIPASSIMCYFSLYNGKQGTSKSVYDFSQPCVSLSIYNQTLLSFFNPISASFMGRSYVYMDSQKVNDTYGEYKLSLNKITYNVCGSSGDVAKKQINGVDLIGGTSQEVICEYNFTVTRPFLIQIGNSISTNQTDKLKNFYGFASNQGKTNIMDQYSIILNLVAISKFTVNNNISYLIDQFASKVDRLSVVDISYGPKAKKVPSSNIFVYDGDLVYSEKTKPTSSPHTIVVRRGDLTISGNIGGQNMFIVPNGDITFAGGCDQNQTADGVFITNGKLLSDKNYQNTNLLNKRCAGGGLVIKGFVIGGGLDDLIDKRRANLYGWFLDDSRYGKYNAILNGGSVVIKQNPGLSTSPPPGFDERSTIYESIKK